MCIFQVRRFACVMRRRPALRKMLQTVLMSSSAKLKTAPTSGSSLLPLSRCMFAVTLAADTDADALGMLEAILESMSVYRESEKLLADPAAQAGEAVIADHAYRSSLAKNVHNMSKKLASGLLVSGQCRAEALESAGDTCITGADASKHWPCLCACHLHGYTLPCHAGLSHLCQRWPQQGRCLLHACRSHGNSRCCLGIFEEQAREQALRKLALHPEPATRNRRAHHGRD